MIFLSAQPDNCIFFWQLEIFLESINDFGFSKDNVHILVAFNPHQGISAFAKQFEKDNLYRAHIFFYPDIRVNKTYVSAVRPHIIKQHYAVNSWLNKTTIFYHDSDIVFTGQVDFAALEKGTTWYVSDAKSYLNASYIKSCSEMVLDDMCNIIGVSRSIIEQLDDEAGGAQYVIKNADYLFWDKIEKDSETLFSHLRKNEDRYRNDFVARTNQSADDYRSIQAWCSDMWALLWNAYYFGNEVKIHPDLNFTWPTENKTNWEFTKIYHDAGVVNELSVTHFDKRKHFESLPYFFDNSYANQQNCTINYVALIEKIGKTIKYDLSDTTILIPVRIDSDDRMNNLLSVIAYLERYFITNIVILEADHERKIDPGILGEKIAYFFKEDHSEIFKHTEYNNILADYCQTPILAIYDTDVIISPDQLYKAVLSIRYGEADIVSPYDGDFMDVSDNLRDDFCKSANIKLLNSKKTDLRFIARHSWGGAILIKKETFEAIGGDNTNIVGYGPEDYERIKRAEILGFKIKRINGPLFHLRHERKLNSYYVSADIETNNKIEFLKVCNMTRNELESYKGSWSVIGENAISG